MTASCLERQDSEILVLKSIYEENIFTVKKHTLTQLYSGCYACHFKLESPCLMVAKSSNVVSSVDVTYLSPVYLYFTLPKGYPEFEKPIFSLSCYWLRPAELVVVRKKLVDIIEEGKGCEILFNMFTLLKDNFISSIGDTSFIDMNVVSKECGQFVRKVVANPDISLHLDILLLSARERLKFCENFDTEQQHVDLLTTSYQCDICLLDRLGKSAVAVKPCRHLFCKSCIVDYFKSKINDGAIQEIFCPAESCNTIVTDSFIRSLVDDRTYQRYNTLLVKSGLDSIADLIYCPKCDYPIVYDTNSSSAICSSCNSGFCIFCRRTFHGISPCRYSESDNEKLRKDYLSADAKQKRILEARYGRLAIRQAIDEHDSKAFLSSNCKKCPSCNAWCEKIEGCNKMTCAKCRYLFCWLCSTHLNRYNPYSHFSDPAVSCKGFLFDGAD